MFWLWLRLLFLNNMTLVILGIHSVLLIFLLGVIVLLSIHFFQEVTGNAPFIPIHKNVLPEIVKALELSPGSVLYDLGCGDGRVLLEAKMTHPDIKIVGVERSWLPYILAKFSLRNDTQAIILRNNFFTVSVAPATHVFLYLFPTVMNELFPKLERELQPGSKVVTCDFSFANKEPIRVIELNRDRGTIGRKLYVYEF